MGYEFDQAQVSEQEKKRRAYERAEKVARMQEEQSQGDWYDETAARTTPRVMLEADMMMKATHVLAEKISQLEERLGSVLRPVPQVNGSMPRDKDAPDVLCDLAQRFRSSREVIDNSSETVKRILNLLEI